MQLFNYFLSQDSLVDEALWPSEWTTEQWTEKKQKYTWLFCQNGLLECTTFFEVSNLKTFKSRDLELSNELSSYKISGGASLKKETRLASLRNKIKKHVSSKAHTTAFSYIIQKEANVLSKQLEVSSFNVNKSTISIFRTAYYIAKSNCPLNDHF